MRASERDPRGPATYETINTPSLDAFVEFMKENNVVEDLLEPRMELKL